MLELIMIPLHGLFMCADKPTWLRIKASKLRPNSRRFSITGAS
jgi:hypothetical protein